MSFTWRVLADPIPSLPDLNHFCPLHMPEQNIELKAVRTWLVLFNNPNLSALYLDIYSDLAGQPGQLLFQSTSFQTRNSIMSQLGNSCVAEIWFEFSQLPHLRGGSWYHFVLDGTYVFSSNSHIAWKKAWADPCYSNGLGVGAAADGRLVWKYPYDIALIGRKL